MNAILSECLDQVHLVLGTSQSDFKTLHKIFVCVIKKTTYFDETDKKVLTKYFKSNFSKGDSTIRSFKRLVRDSFAYLTQKKKDDDRKRQLRELLDYHELLSHVFDKNTNIYAHLKRALANNKTRLYLPKRRLPTVDSALVYANKLKKTMLKRGNNTEVVLVLFIGALLFLRGNLFCEFCGLWKDGELSFETMRCIFDTKFMLQLKSRCTDEKRWDKFGILYQHLFNSLYQDIMPSSGDVADVSEEIKATCWKS
jgi:hypothetical protein